MAKKTKTAKRNPLFALVLAWIVPGAGHVYLGRTRRGIIIFVTIAATFWAGVAIGGIMTVDRQNQRWWFIAEMLTGVHGLVGQYRHKQLMSRITEEFEPQIEQAQAVEGPIGRRAFIDEKLAERQLALVAPVDTVALAYAGVAGLLNIMCIFDAFMLAMMGVVGEPKPGDEPGDKPGDETDEEGANR